jgi:hypothetical protein
VAGTFGISEDACWMPNSGSYDDALDAIAARLDASDPALAEQLRRGKLDCAQSVFLDDLEAERFKAFEAATVAAFEDVISAGLLTPIAHNWFVSMFSALKAIVRMDPRASGEADGEVSIMVGGQAIWTGPRFVAESLLEILAGFLWREGRVELGARLLVDRGGALELGYLLSLPDDDAAALGNAVSFFTIRFANTFETYAPAFLPLMHSALTALGESLPAERYTVGRPGQEGGG